MTGAGDATAIIEVLSRVLTQLIDLNRNVNSKQQFITKFQSSYPPAISILAYLERINKYAKCSPNCFIVALIYIDRLIETRNVILSTLNVHRVLITSVMLATKVFDDEFYKNAYYAKLGGVSTQEMNSLELEFLSLMNFDFFVTVETFEKYEKELSAFAPPAMSAAMTAVPMASSDGYAGAGALGAGALGLTTPSPPVLMSCGHTLGSLGQPSQQGLAASEVGVILASPLPGQVRCAGTGVGAGAGAMAGMASVVVPLTYETSDGQYVSAAPSPVGGACMSAQEQQQCQQSYFSSKSPREMFQQQQLAYSMGPGAGACDMFAPPSGHFAQSGYGMQAAPGLYSGGTQPTLCQHQHQQRPPATTPTSVTETVFSWGSGEGQGSGVTMGKQYQQQQMSHLHAPTQLFTQHYHHAPSPSRRHLHHNQNHGIYPTQHQQQHHQQQYAPAPMLAAPLNYGSRHLIHGACPQQQQHSYYGGSHRSSQHQHQHFASPSHPLQQQQRYVLSTGGGGYWAPGVGC